MHGEQVETPVELAKVETHVELANSSRLNFQHSCPALQLVVTILRPGLALERNHRRSGSGQGHS